MKKIEQRTINGTKYNIAQASAVDQKTLLSMLGARLAFNANGTEDVSQLGLDFLMGALLAVPEADLDKISGIVLYKTFVNGTDTPVTVEDFQGGMVSYYTLIAEALMVNLSDFFNWLQVAKTTEIETAAA